MNDFAKQWGLAKAIDKAGCHARGIQKAAKGSCGSIVPYHDDAARRLHRLAQPATWAGHHGEVHRNHTRVRT